MTFCDHLIHTFCEMKTLNSKRKSRVAPGAASDALDAPPAGEREFFIDNLLVRILFIIEMIWWTGLAPWELEFPFPGSLKSAFTRQVFSHIYGKTPKKSRGGFCEVQ